MSAVLPKLKLTETQSAPAAGTSVTPGSVVTYTVTIADDPSATDGAVNADLQLLTNTDLTYVPGSVSVTDPNGFTDTTATITGGVDIKIGGTITQTTQPITVTFQATVASTATNAEKLAPTADITYQGATKDELVYATSNVSGHFYQYDLATGALSFFGAPASKQDSFVFDGRGNLIYTGQQTNGQAAYGLSSYNLTTGVSKVLVQGQGVYDLAIDPSQTYVYYNGTDGSNKALFKYNIATGANTEVVRNTGSSGFAGLAFDSSGNLFANYGASAYGYASNGAGTVVQLDPSTGAVLKQSAVLGNTIDGILYDSYSNNLFVTTSSAVGSTGTNLWEINKSTLAVVAKFTIDGGSALDGISSDGLGRIFIADYHKSITELDLTNGNKVTVLASTSEIDDTIPVTVAPVFNSTATTTTVVGDVGSISGTVFTDNNNDGVLNNADSGLAGVTVKLLNAAGQPTGVTTTTDANGTYSFTGIVAGTYGVQVVSPATRDSFSPLGTDSNAALDSKVSSTGAITGIAVTAGSNTPNENAGIYVPPTYVPGTLTGEVFLDQNANGVIDSTDTPVAGVEVDLLDAGGSPTGTITHTDANGNYSFTGLIPGTYSVTVVSPTGDSFSPLGTNPNDAIDSVTSDQGDGTADSTPVQVGSGETVAHQNAGLFVPAAISGHVFLDQNADGVQQSGDMNLGGVTVRLLDSTGTPIYGSDTTTDSSGAYSFTGLTPGSYAVQIVSPTGDSNDAVIGSNANPALNSIADSTGTTAQVTLVSGETLPNQNDGVFAPASLYGHVFLDVNADGVQEPTEVSAPGTTVRLLDGQGNPTGLVTTTDSLGNYGFTGLTPGSYEVQIVPGAGQQNSPVVGTDANANIDSITNSAGLTAPVTLVSGGVALNQNGGITGQGSLSGTIFTDNNDDGVLNNADAGLAGVQVQLRDSTGNAIPGAIATTDALGHYSFTGLNPGQYSVAVTAPTGDAFSPVGTNANSTLDSIVDPATGKAALTTVVALADTANQNAGVYAPVIISGTVFTDLNANGVKNAGDTPVAGDTVQLLDAAGQPIAGKVTTTDTNGGYSFTGLKPGTYSVAIGAPAGDSFSPKVALLSAIDSAVDTTGKTAPVTLTSGQTAPYENAGVFAPVTLDGHAFIDNTATGIQTPDDRLISRLTVTLLDGTGRAVAGVAPTTTDANGFYSFTGVTPGTYEVSIAKPAGSTISPEGQGTDPSKASAVDSTGTTAPVTLVSGSAAHNLNLGAWLPATLGGTVFNDANGNGVKNPGETPVAGDTVRLLDSSGNAIATTTTDANGTYSFTGLKPGSYNVQVTEPSGDLFTPLGHDPAPAIDSVVDSTGRGIAVTLNSGDINTSENAGVAPAGTISSFIFLDGNCNGTYHVGDPSVAGVTVRLLDANGQPIAGETTTTDAAGRYSFGGLAAGDYKIQVMAPQGTDFSSEEHASGNPAVDNDVNPTTGISDALTVLPGQTTTGANAGLEFNGNFAGTTPIEIGTGGYDGNAGHGVIVGDGGNLVHTGSGGNNIVILDGKGVPSLVEAGGGNGVDIVTACGPLNAQTQNASKGFLFAGQGGSSTLQGGQGDTYLMGGSGNDLISSGSGHNILIGGGNSGTVTTDANGQVTGHTAGDELRIGGLSTTILFQKGDGVVTIDGGFRAQDQLEIFGITGGTLEKINSQDALYLGGNDLIIFNGGTALGSNISYTADVTKISESVVFGADGLPTIEPTSSVGLPVPTAPLTTTPVTSVAPVTPVAVVTPVAPVTPVAAVTPVVPPAPPVPTGTTIALSGWNQVIADGSDDRDHTVSGSQGGSSISLGNGANTVVASGWNNMISIGNGNNTIKAGEGAETVTIGSGTNTVTASGWNNIFTVTGSGHTTITAGEGSDTVHLAGGTDVVHLSGFSNLVTGGAGSATIDGGANNTYRIDAVGTGASTGLTIADFGTSSNNVLDLSQVLDGQASAGFLNVVGDGHGDTIVSIDTTGHGAFHQVAFLQGAGAGSLMDLQHHDAIRLG